MAGTYTVGNVQEDQANDAAGVLQNVYDISFTIGGATGQFQVQVPQAGDVVKAAHDALQAKADEVTAILAL